MTQPSGATPTAVTDPATGADDDDTLAQTLLDDAVNGDDKDGSTPAGADQLGDAGKKALDRMKAERRAAVAEANALKAKLKALEDRDKSDAEKTSERLAEAEKTAAEATAKLLRLEVAADKGLSAAQAKRLVGTTREELEADADELLETFGAATAPAKRSGPKPDPSQGPKAPVASRPKSLSEAVKNTLAAAKG